MKKQWLAASACSLLAVAGIASAQGQGKISGTEFNPAVSLILDGRYTDFDEKKIEGYELPGFMIGGEAGLPEKGFSTGHTELSLSANVDDKFYGLFNAAIVEEEGETALELEEAYFETLGLGNGFTIKGGKFFSGLGYLNQVHEHAYDFANAPLVYDAMLGGKLLDTGLQARWLAPTDMYLELGAEITSGKSFPGGENVDGNQGNTLFVKTGGDINESNSWQLGLSRYASEFDVREGGGHAHGHGGEEEGADIELENGETDINAIDFVYKWAPNGNSKEQSFKFQAEFFQREEKGEGLLDEGGDVATADYDGEQDGFYVSAIYQFMPKWRAGIRYSEASADNKLTNFNSVDGDDPGTDSPDEDEFGEETGLGPAEADPEATSLMVDYSPSEFSRLRFQVDEINLHEESENIYTIQYIMSLGAHGAHKF